MCSVSASYGCIGIDNSHTSNNHSFIVVVTLDSYLIYFSIFHFCASTFSDLIPCPYIYSIIFYSILTENHGFSSVYEFL